MSIEYYNHNADEFFENTVNVDMAQLYERFTKLLPPGAKILDAGCGSGRDTRAFLGMGYSVEAFDASEEMVKRAREYTGIDVKHMTFDQLAKSNHYDGIWCCASLLHIPLSDQIKVLRNLGKALKNNGVMYVSYKVGNGERVVNKRAFTDLTKKSLKSIIESVEDLKIKELWISSDGRPDNDQSWLNSIISLKS